ncbi:MAG: presqualene diphosphate synthase HpnD [Alphaproteobacteria bacterium]|nr:presqualene diphosphate synthase HpnD [Alphaproteobacteria bacterium]
MVAAADSAAEALVRRSGTSFFWAMRSLPRERRQAMFALYAFCRAVDDIADESAPRDQKLRCLEAWCGELDRLYGGGMPEKPIAIALRGPIARYDLPRAPFEEILRGMESDARGPIRAPSMVDLEIYCARVAGAVGLQSVRIFGCSDAAADNFALATGHALQLTNILRDLAEDAADGRLYMPREALDAGGIDSFDPVEAIAHPGLAVACAWIAERAAVHYAEAEALRRAMAPADARALRPAVIMSAVYRRVFERLEERGWQRANEPLSLSKAEKLWIALRCLMTGR